MRCIGLVEIGLAACTVAAGAAKAAAQTTGGLVPIQEWTVPWKQTRPLEPLEFGRRFRRRRPTHDSAASGTKRPMPMHRTR